LSAVLAQRLIRRVCENCRETHVPELRQMVWLEALYGASLSGRNFQRGSGCHHCHNTGYSGRLGVFELLEMNETMIAALRRNDPQGFADAALASPHYRPLAACALDYALAGLTSVEEVLKVCISRTDEVLI